MTPRQETVSETEKPNKGIIAKLIEAKKQNGARNSTKELDVKMLQSELHRANNISFK